MKNQITILLLFLFSAHLIAQDSIKTYTDAVKNQKLKLKQLIMPASLIAMGGILKTPYLQNNIQQGVKEAFPTNFHTKTDNYLQFVPLAQLLVGNAIGFQSKHGSKQMITNSILSNLAVGSIVYAGKKVAHDWRPDDSAANSFPSGHTATAFNNATLLFFEYKDNNIWYASAGYLFAASTAVLRMANNKHWSGDVVAGAGVGIAVATIINYWSPFHFDKKQNNNIELIGYPVINDKNYGIGLVYQIK